MSCPHRDLALYAGGDLPAGRIALVESHLESCAGCRALCEDLRADQALLAESGDPALEVELAAVVSRRVLAQLAEPQPHTLGYWRWALATAAVLLAAVLFYPWRAPKQTLVAHLEARPPVPSGLFVPVPHAPVLTAHHRAVRRRRMPARPVGEPLLVKFDTSDPDIVIYWLIDSKTQGD
jgi:anti-sigma factor RsiW